MSTIISSSAPVDEGFVNDTNPFNMRNPESETPLYPVIPVEIVRQILSYLPPQDAHRVMTLNKSQMFMDRITEQSNLLASRTHLTWTELEKYVRILNLEINSKGFVDFPPSNPKSLTQLAQEKKIKLDNLKTLDFSDKEKLTDDEMREILCLCPNLTSINLSGCQFSRTNYKKWYGLGLLGLCPNLTSINLTNRAILHESEIKNLAIGCPKLKSINLAKCKNISDVSLAYLAANCKELASINLESCSQNIMNGLGNLAACPINTLNLSRNYSWEFGITESILNNLAAFFPKLTSIDLSGNRLTHAGFANFIGGCSTLTSISLPDYPINDAGLELLAKHPNLNSIDLTFSKGITYPYLQTLLKQYPDFHGKIKILNVGNRTLLGMVSCFTNEELIGIVKLWPNLTSLNLSDCNEIDDKDLEALPTMEKLLEIDLTRLKISDNGLVALANKFPNLTSIKLNGCSKTTDVGLGALARNCPNLTSIDLSYCFSVTIDGLYDLAQNCSKLASFSLSDDRRYAYSLSKRGIKKWQSRFSTIKISGWCERRVN